ncbi:unnamed protein product, partial [Durusdinium trenchii]
ECVLRPMGLAWPGLAPEHVAGVPQGLPVPSFGKKRKASERGRLFAIGEDAALAALRSAGQALAAEVDDVVGLLQYWTTDAGRFFPVAEKVVKSLPSKVTLEVVVATEDENEAKVKLLQQELSSKVVLERLSLEDAAVVGKGVFRPPCGTCGTSTSTNRLGTVVFQLAFATATTQRRIPGFACTSSSTLTAASGATRNTLHPDSVRGASGSIEWRAPFWSTVVAGSRAPGC